MVTCPACDAVIDVDDDELDEGDPLGCDECGASFHVTGVDPLELESDADDDDDEDEDFDEFDEDDEDEEEEEEDEDENW